MILQKELQSFSDKFALDINPEFFKNEQINSFVLEHTKVFLSLIPKEGLKLTVKGNLPTKVVKQIALMPSTDWDKMALKISKRFVEYEQIAVQRVHILCKVGKLIKKEHNKLYLTRKGQKFLTLTAPLQFASLFMMFFELNLGYFDGFQESPLVYQLTPAFVQLLRDKKSLPRETEVFGAIMLEMIPHLYDLIEKEISVKMWGEVEKENIFFDILEHRVITNFLSPLGLINVTEKKRLEQKNTYEKTQLLDDLLIAKNTIDETKVFNTKILNDLKQYAIKEKLNINFFRQCIFVFSQLASNKAFDEKEMIEQLTNDTKSIGTLRQRYLDFYQQLSLSVHMTLQQFTQLDKKGSREDLIPKYKSFMNGLYNVMDKKTPYVLFEESRFLTFTLFTMMEKAFDMNFQEKKDFVDEIINRTNDDFGQTLNAHIYSVSQLEKLCKKQTKIKPQMKEMANQALHTFFVMLFEIGLDEF